MMNNKYVVITPIRNEEEYIEKTVLSMVSQTLIPEEWIIVNDGSSDGTGKIIDGFSMKYPWIKVVHLENRGFRKPGKGVMESFYEGYRRIGFSAWDFLVKLDGDLSFDSDYFEKCFKHFEDNTKLAIGGGVIYNVINGTPQKEIQPLFHVRGATKIYRKGYWEQAGGLIVDSGWDTLDEIKANMLGWETFSFQQLKVMHYRYTGKADGSWGSALKRGRGSYILGYHPLFMIFKCVKRLFQKPYFIGAFGLLFGFLEGYLRKKPRSVEKEVIRYLRNQQLNKILGRKTIWK